MALMPLTPLFFLLPLCPPHMATLASIQHAWSFPTSGPLHLLFPWPETLFPRPPLGWLLLVVQQLALMSPFRWGHLWPPLKFLHCQSPHVTPATCLLFFRFIMTKYNYLSYLPACIFAVMLFPPRMQFPEDRDLICFGHSWTPAAGTVPGTDVVRS